jgi:tRNA synthetases class I (E and Q), catalytic domain
MTGMENTELRGLAATKEVAPKNEGQSKNAQKKASKEAAKVEARTKRKEDRAVLKVAEGAKAIPTEQRAQQCANYLQYRPPKYGPRSRHEVPPRTLGLSTIGHAKAALLNEYFAHEQHQGIMLLRFEDTNPRNEKDEFQDAILEDLALMGIRPDRISYTSAYFEKLYDYCVDIMKSETHTPKTQIKQSWMTFAGTENECT